MKKLISACLVVLAISCNDDGGGTIDCGAATNISVDRFSSKSYSNSSNEELVLEFLDAEGNNLIENNTYDPNEISLDFGGESRTEVVDLQNETTKYLVWVHGFSKGKNTFYVNLSPSEKDTMLLYATEVDFSSCTGPQFSVDSLFYNGKNQPLTKVTDWLKKAAIVK